MRIKRIEADNIAEAMRELRRELGEGALILHTKQLPPRGVVGWFKAPRIEILGAIDEPELVGAAAKARTRTASAVTTTTPVAIPPEIAETSARPAKTKKGKKPKTTGGEPTLPAAEAIDPQRQAVAARLARFASANPAIPIAHDDPRLGASAPVANVAITNVALD